jgi:hypothetical protein
LLLVSKLIGGLALTQYYYSTQPFLAWCLNHYFYGGVHFAYVGAPFYPYRLANPRTSNSLRIYEDYYEPWKDEDKFSGFIVQKRLALRKGVHKSAPVVFRPDLLDICDKIDILFFYPVVYRVDIDQIRANDPYRDDSQQTRLQKGGSALDARRKCEKPSNEYLLNTMREKKLFDDPVGDFDLLFVDFEVEIHQQNDQIQLLTQILAPGEVVPARDSEKLLIYKRLKKLRDERDILTAAQVLSILKQ